MYLPRMDGNIFQIQVLNCKILHIKNGTFASLSMLGRVSFTNVEDLILDTNSLGFPARTPSNRVRLEFLNVSWSSMRNVMIRFVRLRTRFWNLLLSPSWQTIIEEIPPHTINGNVDVIDFDSCRIGAIRAFAINGLGQKVHALNVRNSMIGRIDGQVSENLGTSLGRP